MKLRSMQVGVQTIESNQAERRLKQLSDERAARWPNTLEVRVHAKLHFRACFEPFPRLLRLKGLERSVPDRSGKQPRRLSD